MKIIVDFAREYYIIFIVYYNVFRLLEIFIVKVIFITWWRHAPYMYIIRYTLLENEKKTDNLHIM